MEGEPITVNLSRRAHLLLVGSSFGIDPVAEGGEVSEAERQVREAALSSRPVGVLRRQVRYTLSRDAAEMLLDWFEVGLSLSVLSGERATTRDSLEKRRAVHTLQGVLKK